MTEREIELLGFERQIEGSYPKYHYYTYKVSNGVDFISNASDEVGEDGEWYVEFFDSDPTIRFTKFGEVQSLLNLLEKRVIQKSYEDA